MSRFDHGRTGLRQPASFLPELESLRGWAILLVVGFHYLGILGLGQRHDLPVWLSVLGGGNSGVTLFFVLSGFLLSRPFIDGIYSGKHVSIGRFYMARIFRILPLYYLAVLIAWVVTQKSGLLPALFFVPIGFEAFPFSVPWWSLCTEVQFYLLLPWIMWLLQYRPGRWFVVGGLLAWAFAHVYFFHQPGWLVSTNPWQSSLFGRGGAFVVGAVCAWIHQSVDLPKFAHKQLLSLCIVLGSLLWLLRLWLWFSVTGERLALQMFPMYHNAEALLWGALVLGILSLRGFAKVFLVNSLMEHVGRISFSIYLVHLPIQFYLAYPLVAAGMNPLDRPGPFLFRVGVSLLVTWMLSWLAYRGVETPFLRLKSHLATYAGRMPWPRRGAAEL